MLKINTDNLVSGNHKIVRNANSANLLNLIRENQPISRAALSKSSKLNKSTVSSIVADLLKEKLIRETTVGRSTGGRKPILLSLNKSEYLIGAIDFDPAYSHIAIGDIEANILKKKTIKTKAKQPKAFVQRCLRELLDMKDTLNYSNLKKVGISIPGIVDTKKGVVVIAPDLKWENLSIRKIVKEFDPKGTIRSVIIENEANSSALAEQWFGQDEVKNKSNIVFISEGIGTGIILNKKLIQGSYHAAGQFGHMTIDANGKECICGNHGCWEDYASNVATVKRFFNVEEFDGNANDELPKIIDLAQNGDEIAINTLHETGRYLGIGISNIIKAVDPDVVIMGGLITNAWNIIHPVIMSEIENRVFKSIVFSNTKKKVQIVSTSLKERSSLIGAFTLAIREIFSGYKITR
ncbi:MAG: ROK family protein [bacterium]